MVFDPMKFYDDGQRRQKRYDTLIPNIVAAVVLLVVFYGFFVAYQGSHVKPKPEQWAYQGRLCKGTDCREAIAAATATDPPFMPQCNNGQFVTDLRECREYHQKLIYAINRPRKHKREMTIIYDHRFPPMDRWQFINTVPAMITCSKLSSASAGNCEARPLTPAEIEQYKPIAEKKPDCPAAPSGDAAYYVDSDGCLRITFTPMPTTCGADEECRWSVAHVTPDKTGVAEKAAEYDQLALDHSQDFYDNVFVPGGECTDRERYRELQCVMDGKCKLRNKDAWFWCNSESTTPQDITNLMEQIAPTRKQEDCESCPSNDMDGSKCKPVKCPDGAAAGADGDEPRLTIVTTDANGVLWSADGSYLCFAGGGCPEPSAADIEAHKPKKTHCKMPADVDVCPQTLDPKTVDDKKAKP